MSEPTIESGPCQATHAEICDGALEHYERISKEACAWCSTVPKAIRFYRQYGPITPAVQCPDCEGSGRIPLGENFVSREMAMDACCPEMEGSSMGVEWGRCERCGGGGMLTAPPSSGVSVTMEWFNRFKDAVLYQEGTDEPKGIFLPVAKEMLRAIGVKVEEK